MLEDTQFDTTTHENPPRPLAGPQATPRVTPGPRKMPRRLILLFAIACGLVVANNYYAQPLLDVIARDFHSSAGVVGQIVTLSQIGFAIGLLFIVPLGDLLDRRKLVVTVLCGTTLALIGVALAPALAVLIGFAFIVGITAVVVQVLVPFAASLAGNAERGRVVGAVMSGLLLGILLARTFAGLISQVAGWRAVYDVAAALMVVMIIVLWRELPQERQRTTRVDTRLYGQLLRSVGTLVRAEPVLRRRAAYGAVTFGAFSVLWTSLAFLLARPPYGYNQIVIGLFGLAGVAGALCAQIAGRLADRGWARISTGVFLTVTLASFGLLALGAHSLVALIAGIILLDLGAQGTHITNQSEIYRLHAEARSRLTTAYMLSYFIGGAVGSSASAIVFNLAGWGAVSLLGAIFGAIGVAFWLTELRIGPNRGVV
jgi:predicted MFS family arabinose efflux permease